MAGFKTSPSVWFSLPSLILMFFTGCVVLQGCAPIDQRTFDPDAGKPPQLHTATPATPKTQAPFLQILDGTTPNDYATPVDTAVKTALSRKPNILFIVQGIAPMQDTPDKQAQALTDLTQRLVVPVANRIVAAGARPVQIDMRVTTDSNAQHGMVRINVR